MSRYKKRKDDETPKAPWLPQNPFEGQVVRDRSGNQLTFLEGCWHTQAVADYMRLPAAEQQVARSPKAVRELVAGLVGKLGSEPQC